mmetsp:Transcript_4263/g.12029  ORF Transcript_4263/g.12029 Transcript_4263/m.12029 type:complete len:380 (-) Transcript_4263:147-1286(-)
MATLILQYVDEGLLDLDATVPELLPPDVLNTSQAYGDVTLSQLLSMTSGVPDFFNDPNGILSDVFSDPELEFTTQDIVDAAVATAPVQPPGTGGYSSTNYILLQEIAESVGGKPANELYKERIYGPLGMSLTNTVLPPRNSNAIVPEPRSEATLTNPCNGEFAAFGYNTVEEGYSIGAPITEIASASIDVAGAAGSMWATLNDMLIWTKSGTGNVLLSEETAAKRLEWTDIGGTIRHYGMGTHAIWMVPSAGADPNNIWSDYWGHSGEAFGYESMSGHDAESGGSFFVATTSCGMEGGVMVPLFSYYLNALSKAEEAVANSTLASSEAPTPAAPGSEPPVDGGGGNDQDTTSMAGFDLHSLSCFISTCVLSLIAMFVAS